MYYAMTERGKVEAEHGLVGTCPHCGGEVIPKCGDINIHHWAHKAIGECDTWSEGETDWHLNWKALFPPEICEITVENNGEKHRADVRLSTGWILEFQHSAISAEDIIARNAFWKKVIWVIDGRYLEPNNFDWERLGYFYPPPPPFEIEHVVKVGGDWYDKFTWRHAKRTLQVLDYFVIDRGPAVFLVKKMWWENSPPSGWGYYHNKKHFLETTLKINDEWIKAGYPGGKP